MPEEPPISEEAGGFGRLFNNPDGDRPYCPLCRAVVGDVEAHAQNAHGVTADALYAAKVDFTPLAQRGRPKRRDRDEDALPSLPSTPVAEVDPKVVATHPGGLEGARLDALLEEAERVYFRADITEALSQGLGPNHLVVSLAYQQVLRRRRQAEIETARRVAGTSKISDNRRLEGLSEIEDSILKLATSLEKIRESRIVKSDNPQEILDQQSLDAEHFVQEHIGELQSRCPECGIILTLPGLPHWAFAPNQTKAGTEYAVWSPELWRLVTGGILPAHIMAYALRTSPEGLMLTARRRGETWPTHIVLEAEERRLRLLMDADDKPPAEIAPRPSLSA